MDFKINNLSDLKKTEKSKKTSTASSADSSSFADALANASSTAETEGASEAGFVQALGSFVYEQPDSQVPTKSKERGYYILDLLEDLEKDILAGVNTGVSAKLEEALASKPEDFEALPKAVQELLEQIESRAAVELEKIKGQ